MNKEEYRMMMLWKLLIYSHSFQLTRTDSRQFDLTSYTTKFTFSTSEFSLSRSLFLIRSTFISILFGASMVFIIIASMCF